MPALTSSSVGSSATRLALGTTVCPRASKWARKRRRISAVCIVLGVAGVGVVGVGVVGVGVVGVVIVGSGLHRRRVDDVVRAVETQRLAQLVLPLRHRLPDV